MKRTIYSLAPQGHTGGRIYLQMLHEVITAGHVAAWHTLPDRKRTYRTRRWRKLRHLARTAPAIRALDDRPGTFIWDDLSLLFFTPRMLARTVFLFHHYEPLQHDSAPVEAKLWDHLFQVLRQCAAVVCVAPYWASFLRTRGVERAHVIYNAFDIDEFHTVRALDKQACRAEFHIPTDVRAVYAGKAVHWKGIETVAGAVSANPDVRVITTGTNTIGFPGTYHNLPRDRYLRLLRACDVGVFYPAMREGWSRCAAEAILMGLPCLIRPYAGLGDLARLTNQPAPVLNELAEQIEQRAAATDAETKEAYDKLARLDLGYFAREWTALLSEVPG